MRKFEIPEITIIRYVMADIITNSNEFPVVPLGEDELTITKLS